MVGDFILLKVLADFDLPAETNWRIGIRQTLKVAWIKVKP
jgi:hypothetical protein